MPRKLLKQRETSIGMKSIQMWSRWANVRNANVLSMKGAWFYGCTESTKRNGKKECDFLVWKDNNGRYINRQIVKDLIEKKETVSWMDLKTPVAKSTVRSCNLKMAVLSFERIPEKRNRVLMKCSK